MHFTLLPLYLHTTPLDNFALQVSLPSYIALQPQKGPRSLLRHMAPKTRSAHVNHPTLTGLIVKQKGPKGGRPKLYSLIVKLSLRPELLTNMDMVQTPILINQPFPTRQKQAYQDHNTPLDHNVGEVNGKPLTPDSHLVDDPVPLDLLTHDPNNIVPRKMMEQLSDSMLAPLGQNIQDKPFPEGVPPAWAESRQALAESCSYFRAYQGGCYANSNCVRGVMVDGEPDRFELANAQIVIARASGGKELGEDKKMHLARDQVESWMVVAMQRNLENQEAVAIVIGDRYTRALVQFQHMYCVLDWFKVTDIWWSKMDGKKVIRYRFEKLNSERKSWWVPEGYVEAMPLGFLEQDANTRRTCSKCNKTWDQVYTVGWMCLEGSCSLFWKVATDEPLWREPTTAALNYDPRFLNKKTYWQCNYDPEPLAADRSILEDANNSMNVLRHASKGIVCPNCHSCIRRLGMTGAAWQCETPGCGFSVQVAPMSIQLRWVEDYEYPVGYGCVPRNQDTINSKFTEFFSRKQFYDGGYKILRYDLKGTDCFLVHLMPNKAPLESVLGANEIFATLQSANCKPKSQPIT